MNKIRPAGEPRDRFLKALRAAFERTQASQASDAEPETAPELPAPISERFLTPNFPADVRPEQNTTQG